MGQETVQLTDGAGQETVQLTDGAGQKFKGNPNSNCCGHIRESKIKSFRKFASIVAQWVHFSIYTRL